MLRDLVFLRALWVLFAVLIVGFGLARGDESYYMIIFGQQSEPSRVELTHTFATFVKASGKGQDKAKHDLAIHTISWMPRNLQPKLVKRPDEGVNLDLKDSLRVAKERKTNVSMWGPFQIKKELFERAQRQEARLNKGDIDYKLLDARFRPDKATNCIHAVSDIDIDRGLLMTGKASGNEASFMVLTHLSPWIIESKETHAWIGERLELGKDIARQKFEPKVLENIKK